MKTKTKNSKLTVLFGLVGWQHSTVKVQIPENNSRVRLGISSEGQAFKLQYGSFEYPDPEIVPTVYDPQKDGN